MKTYIEIRDFEGGDDAKSLVKVMADAYLRAADRQGLTLKPHT